RAGRRAQGLPGHERVELRHERGVATESKIALDPFLDSGETELLESRNRALGERLVSEIGQRCAPPQGERFTKKLACVFQVAVCQSFARVLEQPAIRIGVALPGLDAQRVSRAARLDDDVREGTS